METDNSSSQIGRVAIVLACIGLATYFYIDRNDSPVNDTLSENTDSADNLNQSPQENNKYNFDGVGEGFKGLEDYSGIADPQIRESWSKINKARIREKGYNPILKEKWILHQEIVNRTKSVPLILKNYDWAERPILRKYSGVTGIKTAHEDKEVVVETLISEAPLDKEDMEFASNTLVKTDMSDLNPVKKFSLENKYLENITIFENDDDVNPVYIVKANVKGQDKEVYVSISGKGSDIESELKNIKEGFEKMIFFEAVEKNGKKVK